MPTSDLDSQFTIQRQQVSADAERQRQAVEQSAREAHERLRQQQSAVEAETESALGEARRVERLAEHRRELPTRPSVPSTKEYQRQVEERRKQVTGEIEHAKKQVEEAEGKDIEEISKAESKALAEIDKAETEFKANNILLDTGEYVDKAEFADLPEESQAKLKELGIDKFNDWLKEEQDRFEHQNIKLSTGDYVNRVEYNQLSIEAQSKLNELGVEGYNNWLTLQQTALVDYKTDEGYDIAGYLRDNPKADTANLLAMGFKQSDIDGATQANKELAQFESDLKATNPELYKVYQQGGIDAYNKVVEDMASLPTTTAELSQGAKFLIRKMAEKQGISYQALAQALKPIVYDMDKIVASPTLTATFIQVIPKGAQIIADFKEAQGITAQLDAGYKEGSGYNIPKFLRDNPSFDTQKLVDVVGFKQSDVDSAVKYN